MAMQIFTLLSLFLFIEGTISQNTYLFGVGVRDVSPTEEMIANREVWLGGFGFWKTRGIPTGVHDPIWARAWVVDDGNTTLAFAVFDMVGTSNRVLNRIRQGVTASTGIPPANIHLSSTHTHAGPDLQGLWGGASDNYKSYMESGTIAAITEAFQTRRPARLYVSQGNGTQYNGNRRGWGWTNDAVVVIDAIDASNGQRIATVLNFAAHPTSTGSSNLEFSGDYCHYTREYVEAGTGAPSIFVNGPIGDVSVAGCTGGGFVGAETCGGGIGTLGLQFLAEQQTLVTGRLFCETAYYNHPVTNVAFILAYAVGLLDYDVVPINGTDNEFSFDTQLSYFRIGDIIEGISYPGESLTRNAYPILEELTAPFKIFLGLTGDTLGYLVPSDEWDYLNGYEEKVSIDKFFGDVSRDLAISVIQSNRR